MYSIGDRAIDKRGRIFTIAKTTEKDFGKGPEPYFILEPCFPYDFNPGYQCFIPVARSEDLLKPLLTPREALDLLSQVKDISLIEGISPHERKITFQNIVSSGDRKEILRVILTLIAYRAERRRLNKPFSDFDNRLLKSLSSLFRDEMSIVFDMDPQDVVSFVEDKAGKQLFA